MIDGIYVEAVCADCGEPFVYHQKGHTIRRKFCAACRKKRASAATMRSRKRRVAQSIEGWMQDVTLRFRFNERGNIIGCTFVRAERREAVV